MFMLFSTLCFLWAQKEGYPEKHYNTYFKITSQGGRITNVSLLPQSFLSPGSWFFFYLENNGGVHIEYVFSSRCRIGGALLFKHWTYILRENGISYRFLRNTWSLGAELGFSYWKENAPLFTLYSQIAWRPLLAKIGRELGIEIFWGKRRLGMGSHIYGELFFFLKYALAKDLPGFYVEKEGCFAYDCLSVGIHFNIFNKEE